MIVDGTTNNKHFDVMVGNEHSGSGLWADEKNAKLQLYKYDNMMFDEIPNASKIVTSRGSVYEHEMIKLRAMVQKVRTITMKKKGTNWRVDPVDQMKVQQFAVDLAALGHLATKIPITIQASSGATGKARDLVDAIVASLQKYGINPGLYAIRTNPQKTAATHDWAWTGHKDAATVTVTVQDELLANLNAWHYAYRVADHEFGHLLGIPDEYMIYNPTLRIGSAHREWVKLCRNAAVVPNKFPDREGQNIYNSSLMSAGWITAACHYVTIWDALCGLTGGARYNVLPDQWVIERGTETNTI
jgi:hypothetical protein